MNRSWIILATLAAGFPLANEAMSQELPDNPRANEVEFASADSTADQWDFPVAWRFVLNGRRYRVIWRDAERDSAATDIRVDGLPEDFFIDDARFAAYRGDILLVVDETDNEAAGASILRVGADGVVKWRQRLSGFNAAAPVVVDGAAYVSAIAGVGRIALETGEYVWKHEGLYDRYKINLYRPAEVGADVVVFREASATRPRALIVDLKTGALIRVENGGG